jgi:hypothetical protein
MLIVLRIAGLNAMVVLTRTGPTVPHQFFTYSEVEAMYTDGEVKIKPSGPIAVT